jgi:ribosomal-protein-alanine N-acetyltransferase
VLIAECDLPEDLRNEVSTVVGFLVALRAGPEWELENIVVAEDVRGKGVGKQLIHKLFTQAQEANSNLVFLEVRESNASARRFYEKLGFQETGRRKAYYSNPTEDAILYWRTPG